MNKMKEEAIFYPSGKLRMEGLYAANDSEAGAVICHPHPQLGGCMLNNVVMSLIVSLFSNGFSTLRFNFRGVGRSEGGYDNGVGEQDDIGGAVAWMRGQGKPEILLAGYSFGAWVGAKWLQRNEIEHPAILVSPPINVMEFEFSSLGGKIGLVVCAEHDQYCAPERMKEIAGGMNCRFELIPDADHFYFGNERELTEVIDEYLANQRCEQI